MHLSDRISPAFGCIFELRKAVTIANFGTYFLWYNGRRRRTFFIWLICKIVVSIATCSFTLQKGCDAHDFVDSSSTATWPPPPRVFVPGSSFHLIDRLSCHFGCLWHSWRGRHHRELLKLISVMQWVRCQPFLCCFLQNTCFYCDLLSSPKQRKPPRFFANASGFAVPINLEIWL